MIATFAVAEIQPQRFWQRFWLRFWPWGHMSVQTKVVKNTGFLEVKLNIPTHCNEKKREKRVKKALKTLYRRGVHRIAVEKEWEGAAQQAWMMPVSARSLWPALAAKLVLCRMKTENRLGTQTAVRICAKRADRNVMKCARLLAKKVRTLQVEIPIGGQTVKEMLYEEFGIAPAAEIPQNCGKLDLVFEGACGSGPDALNLAELEENGENGFILHTPKWARKQKPKEISDTLYAAMLWQAGILSADDVIVSDKKIP